MDGQDNSGRRLDAPWLRLIGLIGLAIVLLFYRPGTEATGLFQDVLLPVIGGLAAWQLLGSGIAVSLGIALLAWAHSDPDSTRLAEAVTYPAVALLALAVLAVLLLIRFAAAVRATRARRQLQREQREERSERDGSGD